MRLFVAGNTFFYQRLYQRLPSAAAFAAKGGAVHCGLQRVGSGVTAGAQSRHKVGWLVVVGGLLLHCCMEEYKENLGMGRGVPCQQCQVATETVVAAKQ